MAKIAVELKDAVALRLARGLEAAPPQSRVLAQGEGWSVEDLICTSGPHDRPFKEQHSQFSVALVLAGSFQYRGATGDIRAGQLMTPGSLLLGNPRNWFECSHNHGQGDRCLSFHFSREYFDEMAADAGLRRDERNFRLLRLPATRELSVLIARANAAMVDSPSVQGAPQSNPAWNEIAVEVVAATLRLASSGASESPGPPPGAAARITHAVRIIEENDTLEWPLEQLADEAGLSLFHFLRTFEHVTGVTPHQYVRRMRLRKAAAQLLVDPSNILDIVMDCGFGDLSNFNRAFRTEFGESPRKFRRQTKTTPAAR